MTVEDVGEGTNHDPTCDLFDRLNALKNDEELMDLATGFVLQLLRSAQEETLKRGHVASKVYSLPQIAALQFAYCEHNSDYLHFFFSYLFFLLLFGATC